MIYKQQLFIHFHLHQCRYPNLILVKFLYFIHFIKYRKRMPKCFGIQRILHECDCYYYVSDYYYYCSNVNPFLWKIKQQVSIIHYLWCSIGRSGIGNDYIKWIQVIANNVFIQIFLPFYRIIEPKQMMDYLLLLVLFVEIILNFQFASIIFHHIRMLRTVSIKWSSKSSV